MIKKTRLMIDGHVHVYDCYDLVAFFKTASAYLDYYYKALHSNGSPYEKILLLTEGKENDFFGMIKKSRGIPGDSGFGIRETGEESSFLLTRDDKPVCYVLRGRQIVTRENLEVLAVATTLSLKDGLPISDVLETIIQREELAVLAWGFGKWLFKRGKIIRRMLETYRSPYLIVGDNSGRPVFWPTPGTFKWACKSNIPVINGSDPLPFKEETIKVGSYGFTVEGDFDPEMPSQSLKEILITPGVGEDVDFFGRRDGLISFFKRQSRIYTKKYLKK
jgi:hypothetical protein